jgi:Ca2+-transporting ATPase
MTDETQQVTRHPVAGEPTRPWHTLTAGEVCARLGTDRLSGLSEEEARQRLAQFGPNRLREEEKDSVLEIFLGEIREPMVLLLLVTGVLYTLWGGLTDALTIFFVILALAGIEVFNEWRTEEAIAALRKMAELTAPVRRSGRIVEVPAEEVVPGDVILLQAGRRVPADARILEGYGLAVDESSLTGESVPIEKDPNLTLSESTALAERRNLAFAGTTVTRGRGAALVVASGMASELGRVAQLAAEVESPRTPLQQAMRELSGWLVWLALGFSVIVPLLGWLLTDQSVQELILTGLSLAFATIPEEMPIIITMVLALGAYRLSQQHAVVKELKAVETLGAVTVIATDKTGTLTENRMQVSRLYPAGMERRLLEMGALCSDAAENGGELAGDPLETALLRAAQEAGLDVAALRRSAPLCDEFAFDNVRKMMSAVYDRGSALWVVAKGAPEAVLARSTRRQTEAGEEPLSEAGRQAALGQAARMAAEGLRVIACAEAYLPCGEKMAADGHLARNDAESGLTFIGLVGFADPPRPEVKEAIAACRTAGMRPIMVTGDHPLTARAIAAQVGLDENGPMLTGPELDTLSDQALQEAAGQVSLYARTTPEHKLRIVRALRERGERVAVTGDGINDAPALAAADIGVAMGRRGTDVARAAGDMVLADDNFASIVRAIEEGRVLFANLKKGVRYYLACKVALVSATLLPTLLGVPLPFAPIQIILMELFMDLAAAATFVVEPGEADLMRRPPRDPRARFMDRAMVGSIFSSAVGLFAAVSVAYLVTLWAEPQGKAWYSVAGLARAQTVAFVTWLLGHVLLALNMRSERQPIFQLGPFSNRLMVIWGAATIAFVLLVTRVPGVQTALKTVTLSSGEWALVIGTALAGTFWMEARKWLMAGPASNSEWRLAAGLWLPPAWHLPSGRRNRTP